MLRDLLCRSAAALALTGACLPASAGVSMFAYTVRIDSIAQFSFSDPVWREIDTAALPGGDTLSVGEKGEGFFAYDTDGYKVSSAAGPAHVADTYLIGAAAPQWFRFGNHAFFSPPGHNQVRVGDSSDSAIHADEVSFNVRASGASSIWQDVYLDFKDDGAEALKGSGLGDIGRFPLQFPGTFLYSHYETWGAWTRVAGTISEVHAVSAVPEPPVLLLLLLGLGTVCQVWRGRRLVPPTGIEPVSHA